MSSLVLHAVFIDPSTTQTLEDPLAQLEILRGATGALPKLGDAFWLHQAAICAAQRFVSEIVSAVDEIKAFIVRPLDPFEPYT